MSPDTTVKTAGHVATSASNILNRASTVVNGTSSISGTAWGTKGGAEPLRRCFTILDTRKKSRETSLSKRYQKNI